MTLVLIQISMNVYTFFQNELISILRTLGTTHSWPADLEMGRVTVDPPRDESHGDLATNAAMVLAKDLRLAPQALAILIKDALLKHPNVKHAEVAGPGFINLHLHDAFWRTQLKAILQTGDRFGESSVRTGTTVNVEYASVNPTGPLHIGHCRVAIVADVLCNILEKIGCSVRREYYVNDSGGQARDLTHSLYKRYLELLGLPFETLGAYQGTYLIPVADALIKRDGDKWAHVEEDIWYEPVRAFAMEQMMARIKDDLVALGIHHETFSSEHALIKAGKVEEAFATMQSLGLIYQGTLEPPKGKKPPEDWEPREQTLFRSSAFGDDMDRAMKKSDGSWTYFANDIAYHYDKYQRGSSILIDVLGADHVGYVSRITAGVKAITNAKATAVVKLCQMVRFIDGGQVLKMSKRAGVFVTVDQALEKVGKDVMRFIMLTRKNDAPLDFDFDKVIEQTKDNPVFYVQYAHARCHSIRRHLLSVFKDLDLSSTHLSSFDFTNHFEDEDEKSLIKFLSLWPRILETAAAHYEPHRVAFYLNDLASRFHSLWNKGRDLDELRFVIPDQASTSHHRFALVEAVRIVLASALGVMGVQPLEELR
jgi:arginyl-tRNA synthetase